MGRPVPTRDTLVAAKRRVSDALLDRPGVSGVGVQAGHVVVYLTSDEPRLRDETVSIAQNLAGEVPVDIQVTGGFKKL